MRAVPEFGHALLKELGAPRATVIETFAEVRFKDAAGKAVIPDGAIVCRRGATTWTCLVEVKTGGAPLRDGQVSAYLDVAKDNGFDGVLTISNQITASSAESPVSVDGRKLKRTWLVSGSARARWRQGRWRYDEGVAVPGWNRGGRDPLVSGHEGVDRGVPAERRGYGSSVSLKAMQYDLARHGAFWRRAI